MYFLILGLDLILIPPFLRFSEILVKNRQFEPTPHLFGAPLMMIPSRWNFAEISGIRKLESLG